MVVTSERGTSVAATRDEGPEHALLVRDFANTLDIEQAEAAESLTSAAELARWLRAQGLVGATARADRADLELARRLRAGLRAMLVAHDDHAPPTEVAGARDSGTFDDPLPADVTRALPLRIELRDGAPRLVPGVGGVRGGLATLLVAVASSVADGSWSRLKICSADDCRWAFLDQSKNRSRTWCSMGSCGNKAKTRTYRARQKALPGSADG